MYEKIVVGFDGSDQALDALALGRCVSEATGATLVAVCVYEALHPAPQPGIARWQDDMRRAAEAAVELAGSGVETATIPSSSVPHGLHQFAEAEGADLLVVGPSHRGPAGRVLVGSTATRLLHESPCAFAVAPHGFAKQQPKLDRIAVGVDGGHEAEVALEGALELARASGARLHLVGVAALATTVLETRSFEAAPELLETRQEQAKSVLKAAMDKVPDGVEADAEVVTGVTDDLGELPGVDMLVMGSRSYGPVRRVLLGSTSAVLIHHASYPVMVFPRAGTSGRHEAEPETATAGDSS